MLFESLVTKKRRELPVRRSNSAVGGIHLVANTTKSNRSILGGAVLVASKVLRGLALVAAYRSLSAGISPAVFASSTLALASLVLVTLQQPWKGKSIGYGSMFNVFVQSSLLGASFVCWSVGLHLCGPAVTVIMEYIEVLLIRLWAVLTGSVATPADSPPAIAPGASGGG
eukprot:CAMPEP_0113669514 /NCGR_PEP_ID=MMETSP0038_2-20120614/4612_1 /TAXON_ID=2898 /ORGANISM="Cryptomonas paramecium" /LENGTH=169 /DNA_ID=CAMNT_0000585405 /DNA_START=237 /DNA_END=743 /DNA_ORIENTATION=- /assembly_acc=CAM_ASM_000170